MNCQRTIWKGSQDELVAPIYLTDITELTIKYFTDGEYEFVKTLEDVTIADNVVYVPIEEDDFDLLKDGVVRYSISYTDGTDTYRSDICTNYYLKTPLDYSATSVTEIYQEGYDTGYEVGFEDGMTSSGNCEATIGYYSLTAEFSGASGPIFPEEGYNSFGYFEVTDDGYGSAKYQSGYTEGKSDGVAEQKAKLSAITITSNQTVTREDGWSAVTVAVPVIRYNKVIVSGTFVTSQDRVYDSRGDDFGMYNIAGYENQVLRMNTKVDGWTVDMYQTILSDPQMGSFTISAGTHTFISELTSYTSWQYGTAEMNYPLQWVGFKSETSHNIKVFVIPQ